MNLEEAKQEFKQAIDLFEKDEIDQAREIFEQLSSEIDPNLDQQAQKNYALVQFYLGNCYRKQGKLEEAIAAYQSVQKDEKAYYAKAQFNLGVIYFEQKKLDDAIVAFQHIPKEEQKRYIKSQFNLSIIYIKQGKLNEAITTAQCIPHEEQELHAKVHLNLGNFYQNQGKLAEAVIAYQHIPQEKPQLYAIAQFNLASIYRKEGKLEEAIAAYQRVPKEEREFYAVAQFSLGDRYREQGELEKAIFAYQHVPKEELYWCAKAQFNSGFCYIEQEKREEAITAFKSIPQEEQEWYSKAQYALGFIYYSHDEFDQAIVFYNNVLEKEEELYIKAQWEILSIYLDQNKLHEVYKKFTQIKFDQEQYLREIHYQVNLFKKIIKMKNRDQYFLMFSKIKKILSLLIIEQDKDNLIAHYTTPSVAYLMLDHKNQQQVSKLRLNPTDFMNDPTEGVLIHRLFSLKAQEKPNAQIEQHKSFIGCFTLHHDSLNQFRLYGKENQREASGVSLVLNREQLFESESNFTFLTHNSIVLQPESVDSENIESAQKLSEDKPTQQQSADLNLPLYRCIYFDPDSGLIHVAQREEWTFCREKKDYKRSGWGQYKRDMDKLNNLVRDFIIEIKHLIQVINSTENLNKAELIEEILLPLRYLIKHYAFKEEQECRTIYITQWNDKKIQLDPNLKRVYVDYQSILPAMEKIFLSVGALHHESALQYLGQTADKAFIVKRSHNPFRT